MLCALAITIVAIISATVAVALYAACIMAARQDDEK